MALLGSLHLGPKIEGFGRFWRRRRGMGSRKVVAIFAFESNYTPQRPSKLVCAHTPTSDRTDDTMISPPPPNTVGAGNSSFEKSRTTALSSSRSATGNSCNFTCFIAEIYVRPARYGLAPDAMARAASASAGAPGAGARRRTAACPTSRSYSSRRGRIAPSSRPPSPPPSASASTFGTTFSAPSTTPSTV
jgi:hypothetical protein